jgi:outer membrane protein OmpA-like peptidoglycan-associated protein
MRTVMIRIVVAAVILLWSGVSSWAQDCTAARKMVAEAMVGPPEVSTDAKFQAALKECPADLELYNMIGDYYNNWWKKEIDPAKQANHNYLATEYYAKGIKVGKGKDVEGLRRKLAVLESGTEDITEVGIRSIKPGARLNVRVFFEFDSAKLSKNAQEELDVLGKYLGSAASSRIVLEGHTDMTGSEAYNMTLSKERAESAKEYLVSKFGIAPESIETHGYGFERLADVDDPYSAKNRRVRVRKLAQ